MPAIKQTGEDLVPWPRIGHLHRQAGSVRVLDPTRSQYACRDKPQPSPDRPDCSVGLTAVMYSGERRTAAFLVSDSARLTLGPAPVCVTAGGVVGGVDCCCLC